MTKAKTRRVAKKRSSGTTRDKYITQALFKHREAKAAVLKEPAYTGKIYGPEDIGEQDLRKGKVKVSIYLDGDLLLDIRAMAEEKGEKYQSMINHALREHFLSEVSTDKRLALLEEKLAKLESKVG